MIAYIKGKLTVKTPTQVVIETGGIGYEVNISLNTYAQLEQLSEAKVFTQMIVREDSQTLYGFAEERERAMFNHLISVSGVGPNTARIILSTLDPESAQAAIISEDTMTFQRVKGIGQKTAKRIILDLKDKMMKEGMDVPLTVNPVDNTMRSEALVALTSLGIAKPQAQKALNRVIKANPGIASLEDLIKLVLKQLS